MGFIDRSELLGDWRKPHVVELCDVYFLPNIIWLIKSRRMGLDGACRTFWNKFVQDFGG